MQYLQVGAFRVAGADHIPETSDLASVPKMTPGTFSYHVQHHGQTLPYYAYVTDQLTEYGQDPDEAFGVLPVDKAWFFSSGSTAIS